eukprot:4752620-Pyramimonas_sp.AAC.1
MALSSSPIGGRFEERVAKQRVYSCKESKHLGAIRLTSCGSRTEGRNVGHRKICDGSTRASDEWAECHDD